LLLQFTHWYTLTYVDAGYPANIIVTIIYELWIMQHLHGLTVHLTDGPTDQLSNRQSNRVNAYLTVDPTTDPTLQVLANHCAKRSIVT